MHVHVEKNRTSVFMEMERGEYDLLNAELPFLGSLAVAFFPVRGVCGSILKLHVGGISEKSVSNRNAHKNNSCSTSCLKC